MKILTCFKAVPNWEKVLEADWEDFSPDTDISYAGTGFNCFDESALELALRAKDSGGDAFCAAVTVGKVSPFLVQSLYAAGFDEVVVIPGDTDFDPLETALRLARFSKDEGFDLVLTGTSSGMGDTGLVPFFLSELLGFPLASGVQGIELSALSLPAIVSVGNSPAVLRAAGLRARLQAKDRRARIFEISETAPYEQPVLELLRPDRGRKCDFWDTDAAARVLGALSEASGAEKGGEAPLIPELPEEIKSKIALFPDTDDGRRKLTGLALKTGCSFFSGAEIEGFDDTGVTVSGSACASNQQRRARLSLPAAIVVSGWETGASPENLPAAIVCGTGLGSREHCDKARELAKRLGADFALTRPAALCGWGSPEEIVGQSGRKMSPELCLVLGASGAGAFMAGIGSAGCIIAVNNDPRALIFRGADVGIIADAPGFVGALLEGLEGR